MPPIRRTLLLAGSFSLFTAAQAQRTNTDSLLQVVNAWQHDHAPGDTAGLVQMNRIAVVFTMRLKVDEAMEVLKQCIAIGEADRAQLSPGRARDAADRQLIDAYGLLADAFSYKGDLEAAMRASERMYSTALQLGDSVQAAGACQALMRECRMIEDNERAREWSLRCLALTPRNKTVALAQALNEHASLLLREGRADSALVHWQRARALVDRVRDPITAFDIHTGCFHVHLERGDLDSAAVYLELARHDYKVEPSGINTSRLSIAEARFLIAQRRLSEAMPYLQHADSFAVANGLHVGRFQVAQLRAAIHAANGDAGASRVALDTALVAIKRHLGIDEARRTAALQERMAVEAEQRAVATALTAQRRLTLIVLAASAILAIAAFLLLRSYRRGKRYAGELAATNERLVSMQERLLRAEREREAEAVRTRIARDIHDELGGNLTKLALMGDMLSARQRNELPAEVSLEAMSAEARALKDGLNDVVWAVDPGADTARGLLDHVRDRITRMFAGSSVQLRLELHTDEPDASIPTERRRALYLVVREAAHNALRHADAKSVTVSMTLSDHAYAIDVQDNGRGYRKGDATGYGLRNMEERIAGLGGAFCISAMPDGGTHVRASGEL